MTTATLTHLTTPFKDMGEACIRFFEVIGYSRAAAELTRLGLHAEAKACMLELRKLHAK